MVLPQDQTRESGYVTVSAIASKWRDRPQPYKPKRATGRRREPVRRSAFAVSPRIEPRRSISESTGRVRGASSRAHGRAWPASAPPQSRCAGRRTRRQAWRRPSRGRECSPPFPGRPTPAARNRLEWWAGSSLLLAPGARARRRYRDPVKQRPPLRRARVQRVPGQPLQPGEDLRGAEPGRQPAHAPKTCSWAFSRCALSVWTAAATSCAIVMNGTGIGTPRWGSSGRSAAASSAGVTGGTNRPSDSARHATPESSSRSR